MMTKTQALQSAAFAILIVANMMLALWPGAAEGGALSRGICRSEENCTPPCACWCELTIEDNCENPSDCDFLYPLTCGG